MLTSKLSSVGKADESWEARFRNASVKDPMSESTRATEGQDRAPELGEAGGCEHQSGRPAWNQVINVADFTQVFTNTGQRSATFL